MGLYTPPTKIGRHDLKSCPTLIAFKFVGNQILCRAGFYTLPTKIFSARFKTVPYMLNPMARAIEHHQNVGWRG
ncbi:hypothetical protein GG496_000340 [Candidatus Fervidibacteria bacterium JGI MDM2 JNZ-1-D12]